MQEPAGRVYQNGQEMQPRNITAALSEYLPVLSIRTFNPYQHEICCFLYVHVRREVSVRHRSAAPLSFSPRLCTCQLDSGCPISSVWLPV